MVEDDKTGAFMAQQLGPGGSSAEDAIRDLANLTKRPTEEVREIYERELRRLSGHAKVTNYLTILVKRRVREALRR